MSSPYPPSAPRKLYRSRSKRMIGGVCGGLADYLNMDPTLVRILTVVISLFTGIPVVLYIVALFVVPEEPADFPPQGYPPVNGPQGYDNPYAAPAPGAPYGGAAYGQPPVQPEAEVWGTAGAPWEQSSATNMAPGPAPSPEPAPQAEPAPPRSQDRPPSPPSPHRPPSPPRRWSRNHRRSRSLTRSCRPTRPTPRRRSTNLTTPWRPARINPRADARSTGADELQEVAVDPQVLGDLRME